jgi:alkylation response protein AidB-like acyl-CoA dehydrogenase
MSEPTAANLFLERARSLDSLVRDEAAEAERAGTLTPKCVAAIVEAGLLRAFLPTEVGGAQLSPTELLGIVEEIARQDGSTGWCYGMNSLVGGIASAMLSDEGVKRVFGAKPAGETLLSGGFPPAGRAERDGEDWRVSGHFRFGSGCLHSEWMVCSCLEFDRDTLRMDGALPAMRAFLLRTTEVRIEDNWDVAGLEGTASCDYHLEDARVPDTLSFSISRFEARRGRGLYDLPLLSLAGVTHSGFALGVGKRALEEIAAHATWRQRLGSASRLAERASFQQGFARARTGLLAARALVLTSLSALHERAGEPGPFPLELRANVAAATTNAYEAARDAATFAFRAGGGAVLFKSGDLQRCFRDIQAGSQHIVVSDESWERVGQVWLGVGEPQMI